MHLRTTQTPRGARRHMPAGIVAVCLWATVAVPAATRAEASAPEAPLPPVQGGISRGFENPPNPFGAGHRGVDIPLTPGTPVVAPLDGTVVFAGPVAGDRFVTLRHGGGVEALETTYSFLSRVDVRVGQAVRAGDVVGASGAGHPGEGRPGLHFALRRGGRYVDPAPLLGSPPGDVSALVSLGPLPDEPVRPGRPAGVSTRPIRPQAAPGGPGRSSLRALGRGFAHQAACNRAATHTGVRSEAELRAGAPLPPAPNGNVVIAVAGLGSSTSRGAGGTVVPHAAMYRFDLRRLGFPPGRVFHFSYAGSDEQASEAPGSPYRFHVPYSVEATYGPIPAAAARLGDLAERVYAAGGGRHIDIVAHSQGGVVAQYYLAKIREPGGPAVDHLVTIASPHLGADLAGLPARLGSSPTGRAALQALDAFAAAAGAPPPGSPAARDLAAGSVVMEALGQEPLAGVRATTIAAAFDAVVPPQRTRLAGATHYTVDMPARWSSVWAHSGVVQAWRTKAIVYGALSDRPLPCTTLRDALADHVSGRLLALLEGRLLDVVAGAVQGR